MFHTTVLPIQVDRYPSPPAMLSNAPSSLGHTGRQRPRLRCLAPHAMHALAAVIEGLGHAGLPLTNSRTYSAAFTDDAHFAVEEIQRRFPDAPLFAAGYSLGSLILTKYLAEADTGKWVGEGNPAP